jgi:hypothetical protein
MTTIEWTNVYATLTILKENVSPEDNETYGEFITHLEDFITDNNPDLI